MIVDSEENRNLLINDDKCDKYDYLTAVACGAIGGLIDVFLVGAPGSSQLGNWTDKQTENVVKSFAKRLGYEPRGDGNELQNAVSYLERKFPVNYDQANAIDTGYAVDGLWTKNHHLLSLAHNPDIVGLFFSIVNQFTGTASFISNGKIITIDSTTQELVGGNFIAKIFCGVANWIGHIISDIAGSSGSGNRGSGIAIPFYEMLTFCKFGKFGAEKEDIATLAIKVFENGYDFRFGMATAIPVIFTDLSIRLIWAFRRHFGYGKPLGECIPNDSHPDLRIMLLFGNGTLCVIDGIGAAIQSGGDPIKFLSNLNIIAWFRLVFLILKEVCIRLKLSNQLQQQLEAYKRINSALNQYLSELKKIDIQRYKDETSQYSLISQCIEDAETTEELNLVLLDIYERYELKKPWDGDFDAHMSDKTACLRFE